MKLFPYILVRIAGLPFDILEQLRLQSQDFLDVLMKKSAATESHKKALIKLLENASDELHCGFVLKNLAYLKTNLLHGKKGKLSNKLESNLTESEVPFLKKIETELKLYQIELSHLAQMENDFEILYLKEISDQRKFLQDVSKDPIILNGLLMSSHSFLNQLQKYALGEVDSFAKKQFQTERTFLKYLSRTCIKTSPFSTFSPLWVFYLNPEETLEITPKSIFRLNNYIFALWRDVLDNYRPFYRKLKIGLNPSLQKNEAQWTFLINTRNVESVQKMENNGLLEFIFETYKSRGEELIFEELTNEILPLIESELDSLEAYLLELIDYGFLEWRWAFSGLDPFWYKKLKTTLEPFKNDQFLAQLLKTLDSLQLQIEIAQNAVFSDRKRIQIETFNLMKTASESLLKETHLVEKEQVINIDRIKLFKSQRFDFKPEKLFYEDVTRPYSSAIDIKEISNLINQLNQVLDCISVLHFDAMKEEMKQFFINNYERNDTINLLNFYETFYKNGQNIKGSSNQKAIELRLAWQKEIIEESELTEDGILNLNIELLKSLSRKSKQYFVMEKQPSRGAFIQFFNDGNLLKGFSETSFEGNGKMMGRFLHLFPKEITNSVIEWNENQRNGQLWVENIDGSIYNPNLHPPLLNVEIRMPGSQNTLPADKQISIDELAISFNELEDNLNLIHKTLGTKVYIFDMGFEAIESRSPLYQMLSTFGYPSPPQSILTEIVNNYFDKKAVGNIHIQPRICIGNQLIIQRKRWFVSKEFLPLKENAEKESGYFIRLNQWIAEHQLPTKVFVTISPGELKERGKETTDDYKPQYIDFQSPVFVQLFHKLIKKVENKLKIEEVLPYPEKGKDGYKYAFEYLVQWETSKQ